MIDHELTHALFAWLTFVSVRGILASDGSDAGAHEGRVGHVLLDGDNWLILIAPYFLPTASILVLIMVWVLAAEPTILASVLLGVATAWSIVSR